jgi:hypothetical protein
MKTTHPFFAAALLALLALANCAGAQPLPDAPVQEKARSDAQFRTWIARLHDSDYSKRNAAVQALADQANAALPLVEKALKTETDPSRSWWLKVALQECEDNRLNPGDVFATPDRSAGLLVCEECKTGDGPFTIVEHDGIRCWQVPRRDGNKWSYLYFSADDAFRRQTGDTLEIQVEFLDAGAGEVMLEHDSTDIAAPVKGAYKSNPLVVHRTNSEQWQKARFHLTEARFQGSENCHTDFRFYNGGDDLLVRAVRVKRPIP